MHRRHLPSSAKDLSPPLAAALAILFQAWVYAKEGQREVWDFAEELSGLRAAGVSNADLRWLLVNELVVHAEEITLPKSSHRCFRKLANLSLSEKVCFVLTSRGESLARALSQRLRRPPVDGGLENSGGRHARIHPQWRTDLRELWVTEILVKRFQRPAPNQETVLGVFQEKGWPLRIDDPLTCSPERDAKQRLHDTINHLNRGQTHALIHFAGDGTGRGIRWRMRGLERYGNGADQAGLRQQRSDLRLGRLCDPSPRESMEEQR